jgi:anti-anti-sigma factor
LPGDIDSISWVRQTTDDGYQAAALRGWLRAALNRLWDAVTSAGGELLMVDTPRIPHAGAATIVVTLPREIDLANAGRVDEDLTAAFGPGVGVVVADMSGTRFCDTSGIRALVMAHKRAKAGNVEFRVVAGPGEVRRVLEILGLDTVLAIYPRLDVALVAGDRPPG